jgi:nucleotide-binding universal stress UspA family protein
MFRKILVPLDGSTLAATILPEVEDLARTQKSEIVLLTVGSVQGMFIIAEVGPSLSESIVDSTMRSIRQSAEKYLSETAGELKAKGFRTAWAYRDGVPAKEIIRHAEEEGCDLIAMATHGRGEVAWVLGSVAEQVVTHAAVPVLLLRVLKGRPLLDKQELLGGP